MTLAMPMITCTAQAEALAALFPNASSIRCMEPQPEELGHAMIALLLLGVILLHGNLFIVQIRRALENWTPGPSEVTSACKLQRGGTIIILIANLT
jgi:hypothetical protein